MSIASCAPPSPLRILTAAATLAIAASGCDHSTPTQAELRVPPARLGAASAVVDPVMGNLSVVARHIAAGLQDPATRAAVRTAMSRPDAAGFGLDLQNCAAGGLVGELFASGQARSGQSAADVCGVARGAAGMILFMAPERLSLWDPSVIPIVTAVANPQAALPATFLGYRSPARTTALPGDGSLSGPILVVLPIPHPDQDGGPRTTGQQTIGVETPTRRRPPFGP